MATDQKRQRQWMLSRTERYIDIMSILLFHDMASVLKSALEVK